MAELTVFCAPVSGRVLNETRYNGGFWRRESTLDASRGGSPGKARASYSKNRHPSRSVAFYQVAGAEVDAGLAGVGAGVAVT